jgi:non-ribosomal peptide synthetase component E (peptide arylation enzyme)
MTSIIKIVNATTGEEIEREMNAEELAVVAADELAENLRLEALAQKAAEKAALLEKLGITESEAALLLS